MSRTIRRKNFAKNKVPGYYIRRLFDEGRYLDENGIVVTSEDEFIQVYRRSIMRDGRSWSMKSAPRWFRKILRKSLRVSIKQKMIIDMKYDEWFEVAVERERRNAAYYYW